MSEGIQIAFFWFMVNTCAVVRLLNFTTASIWLRATAEGGGAHPTKKLGVPMLGLSHLHVLSRAGFACKSFRPDANIRLTCLLMNQKATFLRRSDVESSLTAELFQL